MTNRARQVYVGNIPYEGSENDLMPLMSSVGQVVSLKLMVDHDQGRHKGFGFCEYSTIQEVDLAIQQLNGADFMGRSIKV
eukprot:gene4591-2679_t